MILTVDMADLVLRNGVVYTVDAADAVCEAIAVKDGRIVFVGSDEEIACYISPGTNVVDLQGKMVLPGFIDSHIHPPGLALAELYEVQLFDCDGVDDYVSKIKIFLRENPDSTIIYGRGWSWSHLSGEEGRKGPRKEYLDEISQEIPIIIRSSDGHTLWINTKALIDFEIDGKTEIPAGGVIETDDKGALWGTLKEGAMSLLPLATYTPEQYTAAMESFQRKMHSWGITGVLCLSSVLLEQIFTALRTMEHSRRLALHIGGAMTINHIDDIYRQVDALCACRDKFRSSLVQVRTAKFFADGVVEGRTSCLLKPYQSGHNTESAGFGTCIWSPADLRAAFRECNKRELQIHVHATGDGAVKMVLDALTASRSMPANRHTITHLQLVEESDIARFGTLGVIANVQPYWHFKGPGWWENVDRQLLGERAEREFPLASFFRAGAVVASSSDYPATLVPNPFAAMQIGVTRNMDAGISYGIAEIDHMDDERYLLNKDERVDVRDMIRSFTINNAYSMFIEKETGSLEIGKRADMIVVNQNILTVDPLQLGKTKVVMTFFGGELVYSQDD